MVIRRRSVLIAGGGYGGLMAARTLVRGGYDGDVTLVDRRFRPGWPPASTSGLAAKWIERWDLPVGSEVTPLTSFRVYAPDGSSAQIGGGLLGEVGATMVEPDMLARMEAECVAGGARVLHGSAASIAGRIAGRHIVKVSKVGESHPDFDTSFIRDYIIDATGYGAHMGRAVGMVNDLHPEDAHGGVEITVPRPDSHPLGEVRMWLGRMAPWGYAWGFPSTEDGVPSVRVGIGTPRAAPEVAGSYFKRFLVAHPEYHGNIHHRVGGIIPTAPVARKQYKQGVFLVGDAGRWCCPLTGGGILGSLVTGEAAANAILMNDPLSYYHRTQWLRDELMVRWRLKQWIYGLTDAELTRVVHVLGDIRLSDGDGLDPIQERRRVTKFVVRRIPGLLATIMTRGRFWRAMYPH